MTLFARTLAPLALGLALATSAAPALAAPSDAAPAAAPRAEGVIRLRSTHNVAETVERVRAAVAAKGIRFFDSIDQSALGASADLPIPASTLVLFGNPPLGVQFLAANRYAGLDWPVRMLVVEEADGSVWLAWTDFAWIGRRYAITGKEPQLKMASEVAASIAAAAAN